tara:strand:+ start:457 stop:1032 length:576 start_codon:yes stop_codon:yes gene_type:complete
MQNFDAEREDLLKLLRRDAYKEGDFTLSSGRQSKHYVNCKPVTLSGEGLGLVCPMLLECIEPDTAAVGGLTLGADPLVSGVAIAAWFNDWKLNALIVRKEAKGHGTNQFIEGPMPPAGSKIVVLEDVITTGGSAIQAAEKLRYVGYRVDRVLAIVDRQENGEADTAMTAAHLELYSLFSLDEIVNESTGLH